MARYGSSRQSNECLAYLASFPHANANVFQYCMKSRIFFQCTGLPITFSVKTSVNVQVNIWQKIKREPKAQFWSFFSKLYAPLKYYALKILVKSTILIFDRYSLCQKNVSLCFGFFFFFANVYQVLQAESWGKWNLPHVFSSLKYENRYFFLLIQENRYFIFFFQLKTHLQ